METTLTKIHLIRYFYNHLKLCSWQPGGTLLSREMVSLLFLHEYDFVSVHRYCLFRFSYDATSHQ